MDSREFDAEVLRPSAALLGTSIALGAAIERVALADTDYDATSIDLLIRLHLSPSNTLRAVDLCDQLLKSPSHISRMIDKAEAAGLVSRKPDPTDRRANLVVLSAEGRRVVAQFGPRLASVLDHAIFTPLTAGEIDTLVELLGRIEDAARTCSALDARSPVERS